MSLTGPNAPPAGLARVGLSDLLLVLIVWWTMFSGRKGGEPPEADEARPLPPPSRDGDTPPSGPAR